MFGQAGLQTDTKPSGVAVADFNGDGRPDMAVANQGDQHQDPLCSPIWTAHSPPKLTMVSGNTPLQVVTSDFNDDVINGDVIRDLAVVNRADNTISVLLGVGDGTWASQRTFPTGNTPAAITAGDFDGVWEHGLG